MKPLFILHKQTFRSATNIVEGCVRESQVEFLRFLEIVFSSLRELHYQFGLSKRLGYLHENNYTGCELKLVESEKVLGALIVLYATLTGYSLNHLSSYKKSSECVNI